MCQDRVDSGYPAILLHGCQFGSSTQVEAQTRGILDLPSSYSWSDFLEALDSYGKARRTRVLIAIDALNEAMDIGLWQRELKGFAAQLARYPGSTRYDLPGKLPGADLDRQ